MKKVESYTELYELEHIDFEDMAERLTSLMKRHVGRANSISKTKVFSHFFGSAKKYNDFQLSYLWKRVSGTMSSLRKRTNCFIIGEQKPLDYVFFLPKTRADANVYIKTANSRIKGFNDMKKRVVEAVDGQWYKKL